VGLGGGSGWGGVACGRRSRSVGRILCVLGQSGVKIF